MQAERPNFYAGNTTSNESLLRPANFLASDTPEPHSRTESEKPNKQNPWESFLSEPQKDQRFIITYSGPYSQRLEINRKKAEQLIRVAAIEGEVTLTDMIPGRGRSIAGVNSDGSVSKRRGLFFGQKIETEDDEKYSTVRSVPQGWLIQINGQEMLDGLMREESKKPLDRRFTDRFNREVRESINQIIVKEKLTAEKDKFIRHKAFKSLFPPTVNAIISVMIDGDIAGNDYLWILGASFFTYGSYNLVFHSLEKNLDINHNSAIHRNRTSFYEYIMPLIEIDRVTRGLAYSNIKGKSLIRLAK